MKSIIVFAAHMDEASRRALEDSIVAAITARYVKARASYELFPSDTPERDQARAVVEEAGFEGILVATMKNVREKQTYIPGAYAGGFWSGYYDRGWGTYSPGQVVTDEVVSFETTLWDARADDKLVWAMLSETTNPSAGRDFVKSVTKTVENGLDKAGMIPPKRE